MANVKGVICPYTGIMMRATMCDMRFCPRCGWNPVVHEARVRIVELYGARALCGGRKRRIKMYRITITNLENGETVERTGSFVTAQIHAEKGVYVEAAGKASPMDVLEQCMSMDTVRDTLLKNCEKAKMMYALKDVVPCEKYVVDLH